MEHGPGLDWQSVAKDCFALRGYVCEEERRSYSRHYVIADGVHRFVLSAVRHERRRLPFPYQFQVLRLLTEAGFPFVRLPRRTVDRRFYAVRAGHWWMLRFYQRHDPDEPLTTLRIDGAAWVLATLHDAATTARAERRLPRLGPDRFDPYHWSVPEVLDRLDDLLAAFKAVRELLDEGMRREFDEVVDEVRGGADEARSQHRRPGLVGLTHQDFRPGNVPVLDGRVVEVWDWDLARVDNVLYDVAVGCLQFGVPEHATPHGGDWLAGRFADAYVAARSTVDLRDAARRTLPWYLRFAVLKRLLVQQRRVGERVALLGAVRDRFPLGGGE